MAISTAAEASGVVTEESYRRHLKKLQEESAARTGKTPEQLYAERQKRIWDAIEMKEPDRVPVILGGNDFASKYVGIPFSSSYYEPVRWKAGYTRMISDFEPDAVQSSATSSGAVLDILEAKNVLWPGGSLPDNVMHQSIDGEYMREDEYDLFLEDTTDFTIRRYLPRVYGALAPLAGLPSLGERGAGLVGLLAAFATPEFLEVAQALKKAGQEQAKYRQALGNVNADLASLGFPPIAEGGGGTGGPAFDALANTYRGWKGIVTDMYRRPEKLVAALEKINRGQLARAAPADPARKGPQLGGGGAIHRGSDRFLSRKQFETFYWPTWKKAMLKSIELGYIPNIFAEGFCENRFEYFLELPKGKLVVRFADTDMFKAKEVLGNHCCIMGNVSSTLLQLGSPSEVDDYCKRLIQVCGKGGGFILRSDTNAIQDAKPENVKTMLDSARKYGVYS